MVKYYQCFKLIQHFKSRTTLERIFTLVYSNPYNSNQDIINYCQGTDCCVQTLANCKQCIACVGLAKTGHHFALCKHVQTSATMDYYNELCF